MVNYAAPGAQVGLQVDGDVVLGDIAIVMQGGRRPGADPADGPGADQPVQQGPVNIAGGADRVGIQVGRIISDE